MRQSARMSFDSPHVVILRKAVSTFMDTGDDHALKDATRQLGADTIYLAAADFDGYEWLAVMGYLPTTKRRNVQSMLTHMELNSIRDAILSRIRATENGNSTTQSANFLKNHVSAAPLVPIDQWHQWREVLSATNIEETAQYIYFVNSEDAFIGKVNLSDLALTNTDKTFLENIDRTPAWLPATLDVHSAWRVMRLGAWTELPVVDSSNCIIGIACRERLAQNLLFQGPAQSAAKDPLQEGVLEHFKTWLRRILLRY